MFNLKFYGGLTAMANWLIDDIIGRGNHSPINVHESETKNNNNEAPQHKAQESTRFSVA